MTAFKFTPLTTIFFIFFFTHFCLGNPPTVYLTNIQSNEYLGKYTAILEDTEGKLTLQEVLYPENQALFKISASDVPNFQITPATYWLKINIESEATQDYFLVIDKGDIDSLSLFTFPNQSKDFTAQHVGQLVPLSSRMYKNHQFIFKIPFQANTAQTCYLRVKSVKPLSVPIIIQTETELIDRIYFQNISQGIYFGFAIFIILYNLFIYLSVRDKIYWVYVTYVFFLSITLADFKGITASVIFSKFESLNFYTIALYGIAGSLANIFSILFLDVKKQNPKYYKILISLTAIYWLSSICGFLGFRLASCIIVNVNALVSSLFLIYASWQLFKKGYQAAKFYLYAFGSFLFCVVVQFLGNMAVLPANMFTLQAMQFGSAAEMLLLSLALADKINYLKAEKAAAQAATLQLIQEQNIVLEEKVQARTRELADNNAALEVQNEEIRQQQEELIAINEALEKQRNTIQHQKLTIEQTYFQLQETSSRLNESINYAQAIQKIILPEKSLLDNYFQQHFAIYLPKDVVSGDFYWFVPIENSNKSIFVLADCTGHGVAGAFMSMIGNALLYETVEIAQIHAPAKILDTLNIRIQKMLKQNISKNGDGMDIGICAFDKEDNDTIQVAFAAARTNIFYRQGENFRQFTGDRTYLGGATSEKRPFTEETTVLKKGDILYFASDGFADQNNQERIRFGTRRFKETLQEIYSLDLHEQKSILLNQLAQHQAQEIQRDDICVIGLKL
jgi:serine phosphatase RsbU (regulator of sigma subunit)